MTDSFHEWAPSGDKRSLSLVAALAICHCGRRGSRARRSRSRSEITVSVDVSDAGCASPAPVFRPIFDLCKTTGQSSCPHVPTARKTAFDASEPQQPKRGHAVDKLFDTLRGERR